MKNSRVMKCPRCRKLFKMGITGAKSVGADSLCDECQGIERDTDNNFWMPWETSAVFYPLGSNDGVEVKRPETRKSWEVR